MNHKKEEIYLDLSKCSVKERIEVMKILPPEPHRDAYNVFRSYKYLQFVPKSKFQEKEKWMVDKQALGKTELTYPEFIKLFEGGEEETEVQKLKKQIDLYKECFELFIPIEKWDEANEFLSINKNPLAKHLSRVQKEVEKKPKF